MKSKGLATIHHTAVIKQGAKLAENVEIGPYSVIGSNVGIGAGTTIGSYSFVEGWTRLGRNNKIGNGVSIGLPPQSLNYAGEKTYLYIGDNNIIRDYVTIHRGTVNGDNETIIGDNNSFMVYSHVAHDCKLGNNIFMGNSANLADHVRVGDYAFISKLVGIHQRVRIGHFSRVGIHSKVIKDLPPYVEVSGHPARVDGINYEGLSKNGVSDSLREEIMEAYKILYTSELNISQALKKMEQVLGMSEEIQQFINFLKTSERGICS